MKKLVCFLLLLLVLCGCGGKKLTIDNCEDYLEITGTYKADKFPDTYGQPRGFCQGVGGTINVEGASSNYDYEDVVITIRITGIGMFDSEHNSYGSSTLEGHGTTREKSIDLPIKLNVAGKGSDTFYFEFENYYAGTNIVASDGKKMADVGAHSYNNYPYDVSVAYEVVGISGKIKNN